jgi:hypothetical protein
MEKDYRLTTVQTFPEGIESIVITNLQSFGSVSISLKDLPALISDLKTIAESKTKTTNRKK